MKHEMTHRTIWLFFVTLLAVSQGCTFYHPKPLDERAAKESLEAPDKDRIRVQARELKHPILKPIDLDLAKGLTPGGAAVLAVLANPALKAARDKKGVADAQLFQAGIFSNPQLSYNLDFPTWANTQGAVNAYGVSVSDDITSLFTGGPQVDAARAEAKSVDLDIAWQEWQMALAARAHVYNLTFLRELAATAQNQEQALQENLATMQKAFDSGDVTEVDRTAAQAALDKAHNTLLVARQQYEQERLSLNQSIGFPPDMKVSLRAEPLPSIEHFPSLEEMMEGLEARRLDLVALKLGYKSEEARLRGAILAQFPSLVFGVSRARDTTPVGTTGFSISLPIPLFDRNQGKIAIEKATRAQLFDEYMTRLFEARSTIATTLADLRSMEEQVDAAEQSIPVAGKLVETYRIALLEGHADVITYYSALGDLFARQMDLLNLKKDLCNRAIALEVASGQFFLPGEAAIRRGGSASEEPAHLGEPARDPAIDAATKGVPR
jgi:outer membrane protein TolC